MLDDLINENQDNGLGSGFDSASRNVRLPNHRCRRCRRRPRKPPRPPSRNTRPLSPKAAGPRCPRWQKCGSAAGIRRCRHCASGSWSPAISTSNSGDPEVFDSYVDAAVQRLQLRHGLNPDGLVRDATWRALNVPAADPVVAAQDQCRAAQEFWRQSRRPHRGRQYSGGADRGDRERHCRLPPPGNAGQTGPAIAGYPEQDRPCRFQPVLDGPGLR